MTETASAEKMVPAAESADFVMPASVSQKRFWLLEQMSPGNTALHIPIALRLNGPLNRPVLERALQAIVDRHEILRTRFELIDGEARQVIASEAVIRLQRIGVEQIPAEQYAERIKQEMDREVERPLDFLHAPLLRATLVELAPTENALMLTAHHIISDGWSNGVLVRELAAFYNAFLNDRPIDLPPLAIQYADYVVWQEEWLKTPEFQKQLDYWGETLGGELPVLDFPTDFPRQTGQATGAILESLLLPAALTDSLKRFCQEEGITLFMVFFSAYFALLHRYTGQNRLMIGTTAANRNKPELESLVGLFANLLVLLSDVPGEMAFRELLQRQRDQSLGNFANHEAPFERVLEQLQHQRGGRMNMQTHFLFQRAFMQPATCGELTIQPLHSVSPGSTFELTFGIVERKEGIRLQMEYRTSLFQKATIRRFLQHFQGLLESAVAYPEAALEDLSLFTGNEREELEAMLVSPTPESTFDPMAVVMDLDLQLEHHFQEGKATTTFTGPVNLPAGAFLITLDRQLRLQPMGIPGDVYLSLPGEGEGFEFVSGPADAPSSRPLLKTGFLGRNREDGKVELWGRADDFVRVQGFRFNLLAVATQLRAHPDVEEVAVVIYPQPLAPTRLVGYVVLKAGSTITGDAIRAFLKGRVSDFIIPATIMVVSALPRGEEGELLAEQLALPAEKKVASDHVPLQALLHQQLIEIWQRILQSDDIAINDNFFEIGGNSFLALRMMLEVEKLCGRPMPLSLLLTSATVADLSHFIIESGHDDSEALPVIALQTEGSRPPIFFLHGDWVGGGFYCHRLSKSLGEEQPFYALPPFHMQQPKISSLGEMAAYHRAALQKQFPHGPYVLGGYCIGATVAVELARQLIAEGETVTHLFLIDLPLWGGVWLRGFWPWIDRLGDWRKWDLEKKITIFDRTAVALSRYLKKPLRAKLATVFRRLGLKGKTEADGNAVPENENFGEAQILEGLDFSTYFMTYRLNRMKPLSVPATIFFPQSTPSARLMQAGGLSKLASAHYKIEILPGNHTTCVTKHTAELADKMRKILNLAS